MKEYARIRRLHTEKPIMSIYASFVLLECIQDVMSKKLAIKGKYWID